VAVGLEGESKPGHGRHPCGEGVLCLRRACAGQSIGQLLGDTAGDRWLWGPTAARAPAPRSNSAQVAKPTPGTRVVYVTDTAETFVSGTFLMNNS